MFAHRLLWLTPCTLLWKKDNALAVVDGETGKLLKTVPLGQRPRGVALSKDQTLLYVAASDDDTIQILDIKTLKVIGGITVW